MIYKTLHRKLNTQQRESHLKQRMNSGPSDWLAVYS